MTDLDLLAALRAHLAAASATRDRVSAFHLAQARACFTELAAEMKSLEQVLGAREAAASAGHQVQQPLLEDDAGGEARPKSAARGAR